MALRAPPFGLEPLPRCLAASSAWTRVVAALDASKGDRPWRAMLDAYAAFPQGSWERAAIVVWFESLFNQQLAVARGEGAN